MRHTLTLLLDNEAGALSRVVGLFSARGYNIETLNVAPTENTAVSRITLVTRSSPALLEQIIKQIHRLVEIIAVERLDVTDHIEQELALVRLPRAAANAWCAKVTGVSVAVLARTETSVTLRLTGRSKDLDLALSTEQLPAGAQVARSGALGLGHA